MHTKSLGLHNFSVNAISPSFLYTVYSTTSQDHCMFPVLVFFFKFYARPLTNILAGHCKLCMSLKMVWCFDYTLDIWTIRRRHVPTHSHTKSNVASFRNIFAVYVSIRLLFWFVVFLVLLVTFVERVIIVLVFILSSLLYRQFNRVELVKNPME